MGRRAPQATIKRHLNRLAKKYSGVEFRVIYASNGETAILPVDPATGEVTIENPRKLQVKMLWNKMCRHDGIDPQAQFVVFSDSNPFQCDYNDAMAQLQGGR